MSANGTATTLPARFEQQVIAHPSRPALGSGGWRPTYEALNRAANRLASSVLSYGGGYGDRVAVLMRHDTPIVAAVLAVLKAGRIVVVLNPTDPPERLSQLLDDAAPHVVMTDAPNRDVALEIAGERRHVFCCEDAAVDRPDANLAAGGCADDVAFLVYTSGSTGRPKGVMQTHRSVLHNALGQAGRIGLQPGDRIVLPASLSGGHGVAMLWCSLVTGATLCPFPIMESGLRGLASFLREHHITVYSSTASVFRHFMKTLASGERFPNIRAVRLGSEPATSDDFDAFRRHFGDTSILVHTLSSSECGNIASVCLHPGDPVRPGRLPAGRPVEGIELRLVDEHDVPVADGECGEIVVRSPNLSPGYWRNPSLTAERFWKVPGVGRVVEFRTGDLARFTPDGMLDFAGRRDARIKIHGFNIEPAEVETAIARQPGIEQSVVCRASESSDPCLVAYVTLRPGQTSSSSALRQNLRRSLPGPMIPRKFHFLDAFPLTPHGKIDRAKLALLNLAAPDPTTGAHARDETELLVAKLWEEILGQAGIRMDDDFFELGGDSLKAAVLTAKLSAALGVDLDLGAVIDFPTVAALSNRIGELLVTDARRRVLGPVPVSHDAALPLSYEQERIWKYSRTPETSAPYTVACSHRIVGKLDLEALRASMRHLARRHAMLRTSFVEVLGLPMQVVHEDVPIPVPLLDLGARTDAEEQATLFLRAEARRPFDLAEPPLVRFWIVRIRHNEHWLLRLCHHIISDSWSWSLYLQELGVLYEAKTRGEPFPLPELEPLQYGDYAVWQRRVQGPHSADRPDLIDWWQKTFSPLPPALELPFERPEPFPLAEPAEGLFWWGLAPEISGRLSDIGRGAGATYFTVRFAAFLAVLGGETGQDDLIVGTYISNRTRIELQGMFGFFSNLITVRVGSNPTISFRDWIYAVGRRVNLARARGDIPYEHLCEELRIRGQVPPEIRAICGISDNTESSGFGGLDVTWLDRRMESMPWGFSLTFDPHNEQERCRVDFDATIYEPAGVRAFIDRLIRFLDAASCHPDLSVERLLAMTSRPFGRWLEPRARCA
jgi:amino acid adenylation domain-containing protein